MSVPSRRARLAALAFAALLAACANPGVRPAPHALTDPATLGLTTDAGSAGWPAERWWQQLGDTELAALVERALAGQPSLRQAEARVRLADAAVASASATREPQVQLSADATGQRFSARSVYPPPLGGSTHLIASTQLGASWEVDLFGRQRAALDAAIGQQRAAAADAQAARQWLAASVVAHGFALAHQLQRERLAADAVRLRQQALALVDERVAAGLDTQAERLQAQGQVAAARAEHAALAEAVARERHALAELSGQAPAALATLAAAWHAPTEKLPTRVSADLLGRRADLVALRWRVQAALRDVDLARTRFLPDLNLVAFAGLSSLGLDQLLQLGARTYGVGPALRLPVFEGGRLRAQLAAREADADAAIEAWNSALLRAVREAADELATLQTLQAQQAAQADASAAARAAQALAQQRRQAGLGNRLAVLGADAALLAQQRQALDLQARQRAAEVALVRALGGGYHAGPDDLPPAPAQAALNPIPR